MLLFIDREDQPAGEPGGMAELSAFAEKLAREGRLPRAAPLRPAAEGAWVRVRDGSAFVTDGPFAESKETLGGFWIFEAESREAALEVARRAFELGEPRPEARLGAVELHLVRARHTFPDSGEGMPFLLAFRMEPGLIPDGEKMQEMIAYGTELVRAGKQYETAPLASDPPPARIEARRGRTLVTDGPFAETKDVLGGYSFVRAASRAEAIELALGFPHAKWGPVEVREIVWSPSKSAGPERRQERQVRRGGA